MSTADGGNVTLHLKQQINIINERLNDNHLE